MKTSPLGAEGWYLLATAFAAGFAMMLVELTATRLIAPYFGTSVFTWTNVIGAIMIALAAGYYVGGKIADGWPHVGTVNWILLCSGALTAIIPFAASALSNSLLPSGSTFVSPIPAFARASLVVSLVVFAPPVFAMAAISPVLVRVLSAHKNVGWASGANSAVTTAGALLGTFAPTLWLVPTIGSRKSILLASGVQLALALTGFLVGNRRRGSVTAGMTLLLPLAMVLFTGEPLFDVPGLVEERETPYQYARVVRQSGETILQLDAQRYGSQSKLIDGSYLTGGTYYDYSLILPFFLDRPSGQPMSVLLVGLGAGTAARQYLHFFGQFHPLHIDSVEIDPGVVDLARRHFGLRESEAAGLAVHVADGRTFLTSTKRRYDVILVDVFAQESFVPFHFTTVEFFRLVKEHLNSGGVVGMNVVVGSLPSQLLSSLQRTIGEVFGEAWFVRPRGTFNVELLASHGSRIDLMATSARIASYPVPGVDVPEGAALRDLLFRALSDVTHVTDAGPGCLLTDDLAPTESLMLRDLWSMWGAN